MNRKQVLDVLGRRKKELEDKLYGDDTFISSAMYRSQLLARKAEVERIYKEINKLDNE